MVVKDTPQADVPDDPVSTRDRLVMTAAELLMRQSFNTVSVDDICRAADVKKGTFYHYFPSKIDLALAAYDWKWAGFRKVLDYCFDKTLTVGERLERYVEEAYKYHKQMYDCEGKIYGCPHANAGQEMGAQDDRIRLKIKEIFDGQCAYMADFLADVPGFETGSEEKRHIRAHEMFSYIMGILYQAKIMNDPEVIRRDMLAGLRRLIGDSGLDANLSPMDNRPHEDS